MRSGRASDAEMPAQAIDAAGPWRLALGAAAALVILRSALFVVYPWAHFDSDQAIVGLMAKHLSEGRAFPLFFYGQTFLLGVESWLAVPWFWLLGPTAFALKSSMLMLNLAAGALLVIGLIAHDRLRASDAVAASVFFLAAAPLVSLRLMEAQGGNLEPLLFVLILWWIRERPLWFGAVLAVGCLTREFTVYAVPALVLMSWWQRTLFTRSSLGHWLLAAASFVVVWDGVQMLKPHADLRGPGSAGSGRLEGDAQLTNVADRLALSPSDVPARTLAAGRDVLPQLVAGRSIGGDDMTGTGRDWMGSLLGLGLLAAVGRSIRLWRAGARPPAFSAYLALVGAVAILAFIASRPVDNAPLRYVLLAILLPVGISAAWLSMERVWHWRTAGLSVLAIWMALSLTDHARMARPFLSGEEPNPMGEVARALEASGTGVAEADYWRAYRLTFLTGERVIVASTDFIRIDEYQATAAAAGGRLRRLRDAPCADGEPVGGWYLCPR